MLICKLETVDEIESDARIVDLEPSQWISSEFRQQVNDLAVLIHAPSFGASNAAAKPRGPLPRRPHSGALAAATNADAAGANCGQRDAREVWFARGREAAGPATRAASACAQS